MIYMTAAEFDALADFLNDKYVERVRDVGASFTIRQMTREIGGGVSEETIRRLMNKKIKKRGLDVKTMRALVRKWGRAVTDVLDVTPPPMPCWRSWRGVTPRSCVGRWRRSACSMWPTRN